MIVILIWTSTHFWGSLWSGLDKGVFLSYDSCKHFKVNYLCRLHERGFVLKKTLSADYFINNIGRRFSSSALFQLKFELILSHALTYIKNKLMSILSWGAIKFELSLILYVLMDAFIALHLFTELFFGVFSSWENNKQFQFLM